MYQKGKIKLICPTCKKNFYRWRCQIEDGSGKFCSKKCCRRTQKWRTKRSKACKGKNNPYWKGKEAGLDAIHYFIRTRFDKPSKCQNCGEAPPRDLANISQKYKRLLSDWKWLCRRCHMIEDGRLEKLKSYAKKRYLKSFKEAEHGNRR